MERVFHSLLKDNPSACLPCTHNSPRHSHTHTHIHTRTHTHTHILSLSHTNIHTLTHSHTYTPVLQRALRRFRPPRPQVHQRRVLAVYGGSNQHERRRAARPLDGDESGGTVHLQGRILTVYSVKKKMVAMKVSCVKLVQYGITLYIEV